MSKAPAVFDEQKLRWINGRFMREAGLGDYETELSGYLQRNDPAAAEAFAAAGPERRAEACSIVQEKAQTVTEVWPLIGFLFSEPEADEKAWKKVMKPVVAEPLRMALQTLEGAARMITDAMFKPATAEGDEAGDDGIVEDGRAKALPEST